MPKLIGPRDVEEPGPAATVEPPAALDQPALAHHPQHALAVDRPAELAADQRRDHAVAVGLVGLGELDDRRLRFIDRRALASCLGRPGLRDAVDRLAADLGDARHHRGRVALGDELAGPGDALPHSQSRKSFPEISNS
jgi:hypothetical protein